MNIFDTGVTRSLIPNGGGGAVSIKFFNIKLPIFLVCLKIASEINFYEFEVVGGGWQF